MLSVREIYHLNRRNGARFERYVPVADVHHCINSRASYARRISGKVEDGRVGVVRVGVVRVGRDCDCTEYEHRYTLDAGSLFQFVRGEWENEDWLDGPQASYFVRPSELAQ